MSVLRIFRNLAVLMILTLAVLASTPRPAAAKLCGKKGQICGRGIGPCCGKLICVICNIRTGQGTCFSKKSGGC
jgi:hypothetical protein